MMSFLRYKFRHNFLLDRKIAQISRIHALDQKGLREYENAEFLKLIRHAFTKSPFYKKYYQEHGISFSSIKSLDDIQLLPTINKDSIRNNWKDILTVPKAVTIKGFTSGTSGTPLVVYRTFQSILNEIAHVWHFRNIHGLKDGDPIVMMRGNLMKEQEHSYDKWSNTLFLSSYNIDSKHIALYKKLIDDFKPKAILAYPSSLELLCNELIKNNWKLNIPLSITSSETLHNFQIEKIRTHLGADNFDWYGNAERTIAIGQYHNNQYHLVPGYAIAEPNDDKFITTSLINAAFPLIRYESNDSFELGENKNAGTDGNPPTQLITKINGRVDDLVHLPDGGTIARMDIAFKKMNNILLSQIIQNDKESILVNIVVTEAFSNADREQLVRQLQMLVGTDIRIDLAQVSQDKIIKSSSGKYRLVINNMKK